MLPPTCSSPPCRNIEVKIVATGLGKSPGTPHAPVSRHGVAELEHDRFGGPRVAAHSDGGLIEEDKHVQGDEAERDERKGLARDVVLERDHQRMGWSTTMLGRVRYRSAARETSWTVTASSARA